MTVWTNQSPAHSRGCVILLKMRRERQTELNPKIVTVASNHATVVYLLASCILGLDTDSIYLLLYTYVPVCNIWIIMKTDWRVSRLIVQSQSMFRTLRKVSRRD